MVLWVLSSHIRKIAHFLLIWTTFKSILVLIHVTKQVTLSIAEWSSSFSFFSFVFLFVFFFLVFLGPHPRHMEVPRLGVESELQLLTYTTATAIRDPSMSATYTIAHSNAGSLAHWAGPGIEPASSWILVRFITAEPWWELPRVIFFSETLLVQTD